jgi:hypothetical protein
MTKAEYHTARNKLLHSQDDAAANKDEEIEKIVVLVRKVGTP